MWLQSGRDYFENVSRHTDTIRFWHGDGRVQYGTGHDELVSISIRITIAKFNFDTIRFTITLGRRHLRKEILKNDVTYLVCCIPDLSGAHPTYPQSRWYGVNKLHSDIDHIV